MEIPNIEKKLENAGPISDEHLDLLRGAQDTSAVDKMLFLTDAYKGVLSFAGDAFKGTDIENIYAKHYEREPEGRGAHFDVYGEELDEEYPWLAVYNLSGKAAVKAAILPEDLASSYQERFPEPNQKAYNARRNYSAIAIDSGSVVYEGDLREGSGVLISQNPNGPYIIHNIVPSNPLEPGEFIKMARPSPSGIEAVKGDGMVPLDELVTGSIKRPMRSDSNENGDIQQPVEIPINQQHAPNGGGSGLSPRLD